MKIEMLPLLPSDWTRWTWEKSNGQATDDETTAAYQALVNKDLCQKFPQTVWDDMVNVLNDALTYSEIPWDTAYGSASEILFDDSAEFTASMFNAMVRNVNQLGIFHWNWARKNNLTGFLGREYVRGYSQYGEKSDFVYGWYILGLAEKLNKLIAVLKDEADFAEPEALKKITVYAPTILTPAGAGAMKYIQPIWADVISSAAAAGAAPVGSVLKTDSYPVSQMNARRGKHISAVSEATANINAKISKIGVLGLNTEAIAKTVSGSELLPMRFVGRMEYIKEIQTSAEAVMDLLGPGIMENLSAAWTRGKPTVIAAKPYLLGSEDFSTTKNHAVLKYGTGMPIDTASVGKSHNLVSPVLREPMPVKSILSSHAQIESALSAIRLILISRSIRIKSHQKSTMSSQIALPMDFTGKSKADIISDVKALKSQILGAVSKAEAHICSDAVARQIAKQETSIKAVSAEYAEQNLCRGVFTETGERISSDSDCEIFAGMPKTMQTRENVVSFPASRVNRAYSKALSAEDSAESYLEALISAGKVASLSAVVTSESHAAAVEGEVKETWHDPVQNGTNLYIRSAYPQWQEGTTVHLDSGGVFYEAE